MTNLRPYIFTSLRGSYLDGRASWIWRPVLQVDTRYAWHPIQAVMTDALLMPSATGESESPQAVSKLPGSDGVMLTGGGTHYHYVARGNRLVFDQTEWSQYEQPQVEIRLAANWTRTFCS